MLKRIFKINYGTANIISKRTINSISENKIKVDDFNINYVKSGVGENNVLLMPGVLGSCSDFKPQIENLPNILSNYTIYAWDPPGYGKSIPPYRKFPINFYEKDAEWANQFMKNLGIDRYSLMGWSDGGISALICAAKNTKSVEKLVVWGSNAHIVHDELINLEKLCDLKLWSDKQLNPLKDIYGLEYVENSWKELVRTLERILKERNGNICKHLLKNIECPTLILHGNKDPIVDGGHPGFLFENIKNSKLYRFPDGKHNIHLRYAEEFNKIVAQFLLNKVEK